LANKNGRPEQAGVVAYRRTKKGLRLCLTHKPGEGSWALLKGIVDPGETLRETALKEAWEEAGLHGEIVGKRIGTYAYRKWGRRFRVAMYLMEVTGQDDEWQEMHVRDRHWLSPRKTLKILADHPSLEIFERAIETLEDIV